MATTKTTTKTTAEDEKVAKGESRQGREVKKPAVKAKKAVTKSAEKVDKFAVIQTGGKQYLVTEGQVLKIERIKDAEEGKTITFDEILLVVDGKDTKIGAPFVDGAKVSAKVEGEAKGKKVTVLRYKPKKRYQKKKGHRQTHTTITITSIK